MKNIFKIILLTLLITSCSKDWLDVNKDPNYSETSTAALTFPSAVMSSAGVIGGSYAILGGIWSQYFTQSNGSNQYKNIDSYNLISADFNRQFDELYYGALRDYKFVREQATTQENWSFVLMATVMEAYTFQVLADLYDQIPFSEALKGDKGTFTPHYESGQAVYDSLIARIDKALALDFTAETSKDPGANDYLFGGDITLWKQFANTLKLKIYMRQSYARPAIAQAGIAALAADPNGFLTTDAAVSEFKDEADRGNPMYEDNIRRLNAIDNLKLSKTFLSWLDQGDNANEDTLRLQALFAKNSTGIYAGLDQGDFNVTGSQSVYSTFNQSPSDPVYFISAAESYFLQAEAVVRGYLTGDAAALYSAGVTASFVQLGIDPAAAATYLSSAAPFRADSTADYQIEQIIVQKWASMAGTRQGIEAFFEHNRTGYPKETDLTASDEGYMPGNIVHSANATTPGAAFPKRLIFPDTERQRNPNTPAEKPVTAKVWWDTRTGK